MHSVMIGVVAAVLLAASAEAQEKAKLERGKQVYAEQKCTMCHSIEGKGNKKGPLDAVGSKLTADEIRQWHLDPKTMAEKTKSVRKPAMPAYAKLPTADLDALVAYLQTLKKDGQ